jgi:hypothetical protein
MLPIYGELSPRFTEKPDEIEPEIGEDSLISSRNRVPPSAYSTSPFNCCKLWHRAILTTQKLCFWILPYHPSAVFQKSIT